MVTTQENPGEQLLFWLLAGLILLLGFWLRLTGLLRLPLFLDEAIHIERAHIVLEGRTFIGMQANKWLHPVVLAAFSPDGPEAPWLARAISSLLGVLTAAACIALGKMFGDRRSAWLAGLFYAVLPFAVFHERQALTEPLVAACVTLAILLMVHMAYGPSIWLIIPLGVTLAGAYLTKPAAIPYLALPFAAVILLAPSPIQSWLERLKPGRDHHADGQDAAPNRWNKLLLGLLFSLLATGIAVGLIVSVKQAAKNQGEEPTPIAQVSIKNLIFAGGDGGQSNTFARLSKDLGVYADTQVKYAGWAAIALTGLALIWLVIGGKRAALLFLLIPGLVFAAVPLLAERPAGYLAPRYLHATAAPLVVLFALTVVWLSQGRRTRWVGLALSAALIGQALFFDTRLINDPRAVRLPEPDQIQYQTGEPSGYGHVDVAEYVLALKQSRPDLPANLLINGSSERLIAYLGPRTGAIWRYRGDAAQRHAIAGMLAAGEPVYFAVIDSTEDSPTPPFDARMELLESFDGGWCLQRLYQITGANGPFANAIYAQIPPEPEQITPDIEALAGTLADAPVIVYPAKFGPPLAALTDQDVAPLELDSWPLDAGEISANIDQLPTDRTPVDLVLANEAASDPDRRVLLTFEQNLYRVNEAWFGLLHRIGYVTGPANPPLEPLDAAFEDVIELQAGAILDREVQPGAVIRFAFRWTTPVPVQDSFVVFAHVVGEDGTLWAQHDSVPGSGLLPLTAWEPGQPITDRFTITLPDDIPPGEYAVRLGLYHPDSGLRLRVTEGRETGPDDVVVGRVTITE
jgi:hypothetical protein